MTTTITHQLGGFFVRGISEGWYVDLDGLAQYLGARRICWADADRTALFAVCDDSKRVAEQLLEILDERGLSDRRQKVTFVPLDRRLTAIVFEYYAVTSGLHTLLGHDGIEAISQVGPRTLLLSHPDKMDDDTALGAEQTVWNLMQEQGTASNDGESVPYAWPKPHIGHDQLIELDETTLAVRIKATLHVDAGSLTNRGVNLVRVGTEAVVLGAGERPAPTPDEPERTERPTSFERTAGLAAALHALSLVPNGLRFEPEPELVNI
jgi:hypothetical protein